MWAKAKAKGKEATKAKTQVKVCNASKAKVKAKEMEVTKAKIHKVYVTKVDAGNAQLESAWAQTKAHERCAQSIPIPDAQRERADECNHQ